MAEDEIARHSRKIYKLWFNKELRICHKISEFLIEITIIVFAGTAIFNQIFKDAKRLTDSTDNMIVVIKSDEPYNSCGTLSSPVQDLERHDKNIQLMKIIIAKINKEYNGQIILVNTCKSFNPSI